MATSISGSVNVSPEGLQGLQNIPQQIETLVTTAKQALNAVQSGSDQGSPLGALLAGFQSLGQTTAQLPSLDSVLGPLQSITGALPDRALADITAIRNAVDGALEIFGPTKDLVLSGNLEKAMEDGVGRVLDVAASRLRPGDEVNEMFGKLGDFFKLFAALLEWKQNPPDANAAVEFLSGLLIGAPHDLLAHPFAIVDATLQPLENILADSPDLRLWRGAVDVRVSFWNGIEARFSGGAAVDWGQVEADLRTESQLVLDLRAARDRLLADTISALGGIHLSALADVGTAVAAVPPTPDLRLMTILHGLRDLVASALTDLENWTPTPDELRRLARGLSDGLREFLEQSPLGQLRNLMLDFQHRLLSGIESLPFLGLARKVEQFLRDIAHAIDALDANAIRQPIQDFFNTIEDKIKSGATSAVRDSVGVLWKNVEDVFNQINTLLTSVATTLQGLVTDLQNLLQQLQPTLQAITASIEKIDSLLANFDLLEAADQVVAELNKIRDKIQSIDFDKLPGPAVSLVHEGAQALRQIDVAGAVNPPLSEILDKIDPTAILQQVSAGIGGAMQQLKLFDPQALIAKLDQPVDELLGVLRDFGPDRLKALIDEALKPVEDAIKSLDITQLLAPVEHLFNELTARVDAILDPNAIFAPLEELFKPVEDLIDALEPTRLIGLVAPHSDSVGEAVGSAAGPPPVMASAGAMLKDAIKPAAEAEEDLFGFRPGDLLIPLIDLYRKFREVFDPIDDLVLEPTARLLQQAFHGRLAGLQPMAISLRIDGALSLVADEFQPAKTSVRFGPALVAYHNAVKSVGAASRKNLAAADRTTANRVIALLNGLNPLTLVPAPSQVEGIVTASVSVRASVNLDSLQAAIPGLNKLQQILPGFLSTPEVGAEALRQFIADLDPTPLRIEINKAFDEIGKRLVALQAPLMAGIDEFMGVIEDFIMPVSPGHIIELAKRLHAALKEQLLAFSPATFKDEVKLIFDAVKAQLAAFDPAFLAQELNGLRDELLHTLETVVGGLLPDMQPFLDLQQKLADLKPSRILMPAVEALKPVSDLIAKLDVKQLMQPLIDAIAKVRQDLPEVISRIEGALDDVLDAIPEGGPASGTVSASAQVSV